MYVICKHEMYVNTKVNADVKLHRVELRRPNRQYLNFQDYLSQNVM